MAEPDKSYQQLLLENQQLSIKLQQAEETLNAIRTGQIDAIVITDPDGQQQIYTLKGADHTYRLLIEQMRDGAFTLNDEGIILYGNSRAAELLGVPLEVVIGSSVHRFVASSDQPLFKALLTKARVEPASNELNFETGAGERVPVYVSANILQMDEFSVLCMVVADLTEQKRNEAVLASERLARSILEQAAEAIIVCDEHGTIIRASQTAHQLCGQNPMLQPFDAAFPVPDVYGQIEAINGTTATVRKRFSLTTVLQGKTLHGIETKLIRQDGRAFNLLLSAAPLINVESHLLGCVVTLTDITERKLVEGLKQQRDFLDLVVELASEGIAVIDEQGRLPIYNYNMGKITGYSKEEMEADNFLTLLFPAVLKEGDGPGTGLPAPTQQQFGNEREIVRKDGSYRQVIISTRSFHHDQHKMRLVALRDITARKQSEEKIRTSLEEKEVLLKEIHHRVKNNMTVVYSLLSLQARHVEDKAGRRALEESQQRIKSMANIHERLYHSKNLARIKMDEYIQDLVEDLCGSYGATKTTLLIDASEVELELDQAIPCGLIINELVTNALKYAFVVDQNENKIVVRLRSQKRRYELAVSDNGCGLPSDFDLAKLSSLGLKLVSVLARQINGELNMESTDPTSTARGGTTFRINFALAQKKKSRLTS